MMAQRYSDDPCFSVLVQMSDQLERRFEIRKGQAFERNWTSNHARVTNIPKCPRNLPDGRKATRGGWQTKGQRQNTSGAQIVSVQTELRVAAVSTVNCPSILL